MLAAAFAHWWYGAGWKLVQKNVQIRTQRTLDSFSVPTLLKTLFAPWKRILTSPGAGLSEHMRAMVDNAVSRLVGFTIRVIVLLSAAVCYVGIGVAGIVQIIVWPLVPILIVVCLILGVVKGLGG
jgi:hypothetical protein